MRDRREEGKRKETEERERGMEGRMERRRG